MLLEVDESGKKNMKKMGGWQLGKRMGRLGFWCVVGWFFFVVPPAAGQGGTGSVIVSWDANTEPDLKGYKVYYGTASRSYDHVIDVGNVTEYTINNLAAGVTYYFAVTAYDTAFNESDFSQEVSIYIGTAQDTSGNSNPNQPASPPKVTDVVALNLQTLRVYFDQPVDAVSATNPGNYVIQPAVQIVKIVIDGTGMFVTITTSTHQIETDYTITIRNVKNRQDVAMQQQQTFQYRFPDTIPPFVSGIELVSPTMIVVSYSEPMNANSIRNIGNYSIQPSLRISQIDVSDDLQHAVLHTEAHTQSVTYVLTIANVADAHGNVMPAPFSISYSFQEQSTPTVASVRVKDNQTLEIFFSQKMDYSSLTDKSHYRIEPTVAILDVVADSTLQKVTLRTGEHQSQITYKLTVEGVKSFQGVPMAEPFSFTYSFEDLQPPYVEKMELVSLAELVIYFSEKMDRTTVLNPSNYRITPEKAIQGVSIDSSERVVTLRTEKHEYGIRYVIELKGLTDQAGNEIPKNYSLAYEFLRPARVDSLTPTYYETATLQEGNPYYVDRDYRIASIPADLKNLTWIKTANNDKFSTGDRFLSFRVSSSVIVYVGYDERIGNLPSWLKDWNETDYIIQDDQGVRFRCYSKNFAPGWVYLGGNYGTDASNMYVVLVQTIGRGKVEYPEPPAPRSGNENVVSDYILMQNYPNPFNPSTSIPFMAKKEGQVVLEIYDLVGRLIRRYQVRVPQPGKYRVIWDGRDELGMLCGSGVYVYILRTEKFVQSRKMVLVR